MKISHTFKALRQDINPDATRKFVDFSLPSLPMVEACRADDFDFFQPFIAAGSLTIEQMRHACQRYHLGKTKSGQPIFWMIDDMFTPLDAHIGGTWISTLLKAREPLIASWRVEHCLFGLHLLFEEGGGRNEEGDYSKHYKWTPADNSTCTNPAALNISPSTLHLPPSTKSVAVVESEKTAVILSELFPESIWMAYATTSHLTPDLFAPLQGCTVILYPRTDPTLSTFLFFEELAALVRQHYDLDITVDTTLEDHATDEQKDRCIDLVDFLFVTQRSSSARLLP